MERRHGVRTGEHLHVAIAAMARVMASGANRLVLLVDPHEDPEYERTVVTRFRTLATRLSSSFARGTFNTFPRILRSELTRIQP